MIVPDRFVYLIATIPLILVWIFLYWHRRDLRHEMLVMSGMIGVLSLATNYFWWKIDWWRPATMIGTAVGIEDFLIGFSSGGVMAVIYEELFRKRHQRLRGKQYSPEALTILLLLANTTGFLFWAYQLTSFVSSTIAMTLASALMVFFRRDLFTNALLSGMLMAVLSLLFYFTILFLSPTWMDTAYRFEFLSGIRIARIPIEELVFWFLAGFVFGPFYEYWQRVRLVQTRP